MLCSRTQRSAASEARIRKQNQNIISNASLVNNCFITQHLAKEVQVSLHLEKTCKRMRRGLSIGERSSVQRRKVGRS